MPIKTQRLLLEQGSSAPLLEKMLSLSTAKLQHHAGGDEIRKLTERWLYTINHRMGPEPEKVTAELYARQGILVGTLAEEIYKGRTEIEQYFKHFFTKPGLRGEISTRHESYVQLFRSHPGIAINSGMYTFFWKEGNVEKPHLARFTFVYEQQANGYWLIVNHHSSLQPVKPGK